MAAGEALLPSGRWREPKTAIARATAACVQEMAGVDKPEISIPSFTVRTEIQGIYKEDAPIRPEEFKNQDNIRIRLKLSKGMWRIDYTALTTILNTVTPQEIIPYP